MPESLYRSQHIVSSTSETAYVDDLLYSIALWTFELGILGRNRRFRLFHQTWFFTSLASPFDSFRLNCVHRHALQAFSLRLVSLSWVTL